MEWIFQPSTIRGFSRSSLSLIYCVLILVVSQNAVVSDDKEPTWNTSRIHQCITDLSSSNFRARDQATRELQHAGVPAVELLLGSAQCDDAEVVWRSKHVLIQFAGRDLRRTGVCPHHSQELTAQQWANGWICPAQSGPVPRCQYH